MSASPIWHLQGVSQLFCVAMASRKGTQAGANVLACAAVLGLGRRLGINGTSFYPPPFPMRAGGAWGMIVRWTPGGGGGLGTRAWCWFVGGAYWPLATVSGS